jgi:hypothetical protein
MSETVKVMLYLEIEVEVTGDYKEKKIGSYEIEPESEEFIIDKVIWQGLNISKALESEDYDFIQMEQDCLERINKQD